MALWLQWPNTEDAQRPSLRNTSCETTPQPKYDRTLTTTHIGLCGLWRQKTHVVSKHLAWPEKESNHRWKLELRNASSLDLALEIPWLYPGLLLLSVVVLHHNYRVAPAVLSKVANAPWYFLWEEKSWSFEQERLSTASNLGINYGWHFKQLQTKEVIHCWVFFIAADGRLHIWTWSWGQQRYLLSWCSFLALWLKSYQIKNLQGL